jgi:DNA-directed RNA polymerase III subunit RPC8
MFLLHTVRDAVRISPTNFQCDWSPGLHDEIDSRYANKVVPGVGLVVCCADVLHCGDAVLPAGDGAAFADGA